MPMPRLTGFAPTCYLALIGLALMPTALRAQDHSEHDMSQMEGGMDGMSHDGHAMSEEDYAVLRDRIPLYKEYSNEPIMLEMQMMDPDETRYLSAMDKTGKVGILVLIHGLGAAGNAITENAVKPIGAIYPTAISSGMSMMGSAHIQEGLDKLTAAGAEKIIVVPIVATKHNSLYRQWMHVFGKLEDGAYLDVPQATTSAELIFVDPFDDHPLVHEMLLDHATELSTDPANTDVYVLAHGPHYDDDNQAQLEMLGRLAERVKDIGGFNAVTGITLQDDAPTATRAANVERLRGMIEASNAAGREVVVVTNLMSGRSIQWRIEKDLEGLDYKFNVKGLAQHDNFVRWFQSEVMDAQEG